MSSGRISTADLFLAFRQAKSALFFEKRGVGMNELASYEQDLPENLKRLKRRLAGDSWFDRLQLGEVWLVPKRYHSVDIPEDDVVRIGSDPRSEAARPIDVQVRLSPNADFAITEVLYLWRFGALLESVLTDDVVGYRLDLRNGSSSKYRRWLFDYWPKKYREFRSAPLSAAKELLAGGKDALIMSGDLANFYDTVDPAFLLTVSFLDELRAKGASQSEIRKFKKATKSLLAAYGRFRLVASKRLSVPVTVGIPIGALTSRIVANVALATLDRLIGNHSEITCYRRYVDDFVIVGAVTSKLQSDDVIRTFLPVLHGPEGLLQLDVGRLDRNGSEFQIQKRKIRVHHLGGEPGADFLDAVESDFTNALSERRAFVDASTLLGDGVTHLIRASNAEGSPLRVLREADRTRLERFALSTSLRSLERVSSMIDHDEARQLVRRCLSRVGRVLDAEGNWVDDLDVSLRLLKLAIITSDWDSARELRKRMDREWGTVKSLRKTAGELYYKGQRIDSSRVRPWIWLRNYLHERRLEAICACLPIGINAEQIASKLRDGVRVRKAVLGATTLRRRAEKLALTDLRARDREEDGFLAGEAEQPSAWLRKALRNDKTLIRHLEGVDAFLKKCRDLGDKPWLMPAAKMYLCTRPPSYFDIARRWLSRIEQTGFGETTFEELLNVVNGVRGTQYGDAVAQTINPSTIYVEGNRARAIAGEAPARLEPRIILGNLVVQPDAWLGAATRVTGSNTGKPVLSKKRLLGLANILEKAEQAARANSVDLLVLPELALPRKWLRVVANHVVKGGSFGLVTGLEYHHYSGPYVANQAVAVLPGPFMSVAAWPWTKHLPAREEENQLARLKIPLAFAPAPPNRIPRTVIRTQWGSFSVLVCSELIEARRVSDLLGRADVVLCPAWNSDTASYDHLIQSVGFQLHAIIAIANNGHYSDCRAWAPLTERWERDLCRLIERDVDDIVYVDIPVQSLCDFHAGDKQAKNQYEKIRILLRHKQYAQVRRELERLENELAGAWRPLPPDWP